MGNFNVSGGISRAPLLEALTNPSRSWVYFDDFFTFDDTATVGDWVATNATAGDAEKADGAGGIVLLESDSTTDDQGIQMQSSAETVLLGAGKPVYCEARLKISDVDKCQFCFGLAKVDTTIFASGELTAAGTTPRALIYMSATTQASATTAGKGQFTVGDGSGSNDMANTTGLAFVDDTWTVIGFSVDYDANEARIYQDGRLIEILALTRANIPTEELAVSFAALSEGTPASEILLNIDYVLVSQPR